MELSEVEEVVKNYLRAYVLPANVHESHLYGYPSGDTYTKVAERGAEGITEALKPVLAAVWEEAAEATADWMSNNPTPAGVPMDPPRNPYEED